MNFYRSDVYIFLFPFFFFNKFQAVDPEEYTTLTVWLESFCGWLLQTFLLNTLHTLVILVCCSIFLFMISLKGCSPFQEMDFIWTATYLLLFAFLTKLCILCNLLGLGTFHHSARNRSTKGKSTLISWCHERSLNYNAWVGTDLAIFWALDKLCSVM